MIASLRRLGLAAGLLAAALAAPAAAQDASAENATSELEASVALVSDYRFRGISLSRREPALQAGIDYTDRGGAFAGIWGSTIRGEGGTELDLYAGYRGKAAGVDYSVSAIQYIYPGGDGFCCVEFQSELERQFGKVTVSAELAYTPQQKEAEQNLYAAVGASVDGPFETSLFAKVGRENGAFDRKWDWQAGASRDLGPLTLRAAYVATNHRRARLGRAGRPALTFEAALNF